MTSALQGIAGPGAAQPAPEPIEPPVAGAAAESIIPPDTRTRVPDTGGFPNAAVGQVVVEQNNGIYNCTGFLIDPNTVLTAGHCVHEGGPGGVASTRVTFTPGQNGAETPFGTCRGTSVQAAAGWETAATEADDYGWIQLDCLIGHLTGWFDYTAPGDVTGAATTVLGYPGDRAFGTQWTAAGAVDETVGGQVFYGNDTFGGMSGSPVFADVPGCSTTCVVGVHAYGLHGGVAPHDTLNHGTRLDATRAAGIALAAAANDRPDDRPPVVTLRSPLDGAVLAAGTVIRAAFACTDGRTGSGIRTCAGSVADGEPIDTTPGTHTFTVTAEDGFGNETTAAATYVVMADHGGSGPVVDDGGSGPVAARPTFTG